jgi:hypothetical protein
MEDCTLVDILIDVSACSHSIQGESRTNNKEVFLTIPITFHMAIYTHLDASSGRTNFSTIDERQDAILSIFRTTCFQNKNPHKAVSLVFFDTVEPINLTPESCMQRKGIPML